MKYQSVSNKSLVYYKGLKDELNEKIMKQDKTEFARRMTLRVDPKMRQSVDVTA